ncbi:MAG: CHC2 zinc finger domain-containing protein [Clostridiales bacterium]|nr:CHC2 zinc finger domain-containing protein [Clostridiales bacterium]
MNVFEAVRDSVTARQAAESYGIKVSRNGMAVCPFHNDKNPSMKLDKRYHCFGCQADGDAISFVSRYFEMKPIDAAKKLADDFGISYDDWTRDPPMEKPKPKPKISEQLEFKKTEAYCCRVLCDYLRLLEKWRTELAPRMSDEQWNPYFTEALQRKDYVEYLLDDVFLNGSIADRADFIKKHGKDVTRLEKRIRELTARGTAGRDADGERDESDGSGTAAVRFQHRPAHDYYDRAV